METALSRAELVAQGFPFGKVDDFIPMGNPENEWTRTQPDVVVFVPEEDGGNNCDNCVLAVTPTPDSKELIAVWTQSAAEDYGNNRIVISRTADGQNWSYPEFIVGTQDRGQRQCSWGMPMFTKSGRLYLMYIQEAEPEQQDFHDCNNGYLAMVYSDDYGHTWSAPGLVPLPRCQHDNPDPNITKNWWNQQQPVRDAQGRFVCGFTIVPSIHWGESPRYPHKHSYAAFLRFENLDDDPEIADVIVTIAPENGLAVPDPVIDGNFVAQEASPVLLPDGRLFATMRTITGYIYYTVYENGIWREAKPLLGWDGMPIPHPLGPCPMFHLQDGTYLCAFYNNPGQRLGYNSLVYPNTPNYNALAVARGPLYLVSGVFDPNAEQPIRFGKPMCFIDTDCVALGKYKRTCTAPSYTALTQWNGKTMFWYPDRKYCILGKEIPPAMLAELKHSI